MQRRAAAPLLVATKASHSASSVGLPITGRRSTSAKAWRRARHQAVEHIDDGVAARRARTRRASATSATKNVRQPAVTAPARPARCRSHRRRPSPRRRIRPARHARELLQLASMAARSMVRIPPASASPAADHGRRKRSAVGLQRGSSTGMVPNSDAALAASIPALMGLEAKRLVTNVVRPCMPALEPT